MRFAAFISLFFLSLRAMAAAPDNELVDTGKNVILDYPQALQKAGVKKVRCIFKDSRKFIWIGTENGLYRYDGTNVDVLQHDVAGPHSLPDNIVVSIAEDRQGYIWAGTLQGAAMIDPWTFTAKIYNNRMHNLGQDFDIKVYIDQRNKIWACGSKGVDLFDPAQNKFRKVWQYGSKGHSGDGYVNCLADWRNDTLVFGTFNGAVLMSKKNFGFRRILKTGMTVTRVFAGNNQLWLGTWGFGCFVSDDQCRSFTMLKPEPGSQKEIANVITGIAGTNYNQSKQLWLSTLNGIYKIDNYDKAIPGERAISRMLDGYAANLMADDEEYIWRAGGMVSRFYAGNSFFNAVPVNYDGTVQNIDPVVVNNQKAIAVLSWYANSGLAITDVSGRKVVYKQPPQPSSDQANVGGVAQDKFGRLWVSSLGGVQVLGKDFKPQYTLENVKSDKDKLSSFKTNDLLINHDTVWIACYKTGVDMYDLSFHKIRSFIPGDSSGLMDDYTQRIFADSRGHVWLCGNNRLYEYIGPGKKFRRFNFNQDSTTFTVNCMAETPDGDLLIASNGGLFILNPKTFQHTRISSPLIDNNTILAVAVDASGDIWFINSEHLVYYQVKNLHFTIFGREDGLSTARDLQWLCAIDNKHLFLADDKRIVTFSPENLLYKPSPLKLYFHDVEVNDSTVLRNEFANTLKLKYNENRLNIGFGAIDYIKPEQNLYAYRLSGVDDRWVYSSRNFASYANLAPGSYTLKLKVANYTGIWSDPISMTIVVSPPFWATWWFRLLSIVLIGSLLFIAIRYVLQRNLRERILRLEKEQAVEKERNRIARDMHDDLGSGLTKIAILSEVAKTQIASPANASANLDVISTSSRELIDNLQDIIWVLNPRNDSLNSLILYIREYTESFFEPAGLNYEFSCDDMEHGITLSEEQRRNVFLAVKESCNNILKHAGASSVCINLKLKHNSIIITIKDNGRGFDRTEVGNFSNGLQNIRNRMEQIGAACRIDSTKNLGTTVELSIPV